MNRQQRRHVLPKRGAPFPRKRGGTLGGLSPGERAALERDAVLLTAEQFTDLAALVRAGLYRVIGASAAHGGRVFIRPTLPQPEMIAVASALDAAREKVGAA